MGSTAGLKPNQKLKDIVAWFEIPVYNIERARQFYGSIYNMNMEVSHGGGYSMAYFPAESGVGGALVAGPGCIPNATGILIYLNAGNDLNVVLNRIEPAGGRIIMQRTMISESAGAFALFIDSEGNRLALHEGPPRVAETTKKEDVKVAKPEPKAAAKVEAKKPAATNGSAKKATAEKATAEKDAPKKRGDKKKGDKKAGKKGDKK